MKSSDKRSAKTKAKRKTIPQLPAYDSSGGSRKQFLQVLGAGVVGAMSIDAALISQAFGASSTVEELPRSAVAAYLKVAASKSLHPEMVPKLEMSLGKIGLHRVDSMARVYQVTGTSGVRNRIAIIPFHPAGETEHVVGPPAAPPAAHAPNLPGHPIERAPNLLGRPVAHVVGSISISEGSTPSGVSVQLDGTRVVSYTTFDVLFGKLVRRTFTPAQLMRGTERFIEKGLPREKIRPDIVVSQSEGLAEQTLRSLLAEEHRAGLYTPAQVQGFLTNLPSVRLMAQLQYARHKGLTMSPGSACCSCCCCCWGCCSCTSAVSSSYLSERYRSRTAARRSTTKEVFQNAHDLT